MGQFVFFAIGVPRFREGISSCPAVHAERRHHTTYREGGGKRASPVPLFFARPAMLPALPRRYPYLRTAPQQGQRKSPWGPCCSNLASPSPPRQLGFRRGSCFFALFSTAARTPNAPRLG